MSFMRLPDGSLLGCGPDADYPGRAAAEQHWAGIRIKNAEARRTGQPLPDWKPPLTLAQQAEMQIARLERELAEWREIMWKAEHEDSCLP